MGPGHPSGASINQRRTGHPADGGRLQSQLSTRAWELCRETLEEGTLTLFNPVTGDSRVIDVLALDPAERGRAAVILTQIRWLASLTARTRPRVPPPAQTDDFLLPESE